MREGGAGGAGGAGGGTGGDATGTEVGDEDGCLLGGGRAGLIDLTTGGGGAGLANLTAGAEGGTGLVGGCVCIGELRLAEDLASKKALRRC